MSDLEKVELVLRRVAQNMLSQPGWNMDVRKMLLEVADGLQKEQALKETPGKPLYTQGMSENGVG